jgi:hypothetical protein
MLQSYHRMHINSLDETIKIADHRYRGFIAARAGISQATKTAMERIS